MNRVLVDLAGIELLNAPDQERGGLRSRPTPLTQHLLLFIAQRLFQCLGDHRSYQSIKDNGRGQRGEGSRNEVVAPHLAVGLFTVVALYLVERLVQVARQGQSSCGKDEELQNFAQQVMGQLLEVVLYNK